MIPVENQEMVYESIARVKAAAPDFCANLYTSPAKVGEWIARKQLRMESTGESVLFLRRECDFWHLYFCAPSPPALGKDLAALPELKTEKIVSDVIGGSAGLIATLGTAGLRPYKRLMRLARKPGPDDDGDCGDPWEEHVTFARPTDADEVLGLIEAAFDRYAKQIPEPREIAAAIDARNVLAVKLGNEIAGLLHFENHGITSTLRFWTVARRFRDRHVGGALMRRYLASQPAVRRFVLWVDEGNDDAIRKYRRFHYDNDGIADDILANDCIAE